MELRHEVGLAPGPLRLAAAQIVQAQQPNPNPVIRRRAFMLLLFPFGPILQLFFEAIHPRLTGIPATQILAGVPEASLMSGNQILAEAKLSFL